MSKRAVLVAAAAAAVAVVWAGSTAYFGQQVQKSLAAQLAPWQAAAPGGERLLRVTDVSYERGLLGATRTVSLSMGCGDKSASLTWRDDIRHGPLPGFAGVGAARIDSRLLLSDAQRQQWKALTGQDEPQLSLRTWVGLGGSTTSQLDMPALQLKTADGGQLQLEKVLAELRLDARGNAKYSLRVPTYRFSAGLGEGKGEAQVLMRDLQLESEGLAPAWWAFAGKGQGSVASMEVALAPQAGATNKPLFALQDLRYTQEGAMKDGLFSGSMQFQGKGQVGGVALDAVSMKMRMERLHGATYAAIVQQIYAGNCPVEGADPKAEADRLLAGMAGLLPHNPAFHLDELQLSLGGQTAKLAYGGGVEGVTAEDLKAPNLAPVLMQKAVFRAELDLALPLINNLANAVDKPLPPDALEQGVARAAAQGLLEREGERVRARFEFRNGAALLNGKPMPMPGARPAGPAPAPAQ